MDTPSLVILIVAVCLIGFIFVGAVVILKYTTRPRTEVAKAARMDAEMRVRDAEIMDIVDYHNGDLTKLTEKQRLALQRYQEMQRAAEQARRDQRAQEAIYRSPSNSVFYDPQRL